MNVTEESYGQAIILICSGELTEDSLDAFKSAIERIERRLTEEPQGVEIHDLVLNLEAVPFVDSAALEYLLDLQERLSERLGQVKLARMDENVAKIFEITRLDSAFERFEDVSEAVKTI